MLANMNSMLAEADLVYVNLLLQLTSLTLASIVLASRFKNNAVLRYSILYSSLLSLTLLCAASLFIQSRDTSFLQIHLDTPAAYFDQLFAKLDGEQGFRIGLEFPANSLGVPSDRALQTTNSSHSSFFNAFAWRIPALPWFVILQMTWIFGVFISISGLLRSLHNAEGIIRGSRKLSAGECRLFNTLVNQNELCSSELNCRESSEIHSPVLVGITSPVLLVPARFFQRFSEADIRTILRHEVAHVVRKDPVFNFLQKLIVSIFWFHPLVHSMDRMLSRAREEICDNYVLSKERAVDYGEVLLRLSVQQAPGSSDSSRRIHSSMTMGAFGTNWNLEQRIRDLLNQKREIPMHLTQKSQILLNTCVVAAALAVSACQIAAQDDLGALANGSVTSQARSQDDGADASAGQTNRDQSASDRVYPTLGPQVVAGIADIQQLMAPDDESEPSLELAKEMLDNLYEKLYPRMNDFEKQTLLNFYTNYYLLMEDYGEAANTFEQLILLTNVRPNIHQRALRSLGQLHAALENWSESIRYYELWQADSAEEDHIVLQGLSYAHYKLEEFEDALPHWLGYMALKKEGGEELRREDYAYLNGLYFTLEHWEQALDMTKEMILMFNSSTDWENLRAIYRKLDEQAGIVQRDAA